MQRFFGVIPARYASSRFPGKPLVDIHGKSMIQRVYEQSLKSSILDDLIVATDDSKIEKHVKSFGGNVILTSDKHLSGTDRCTEVAQKKHWFDPASAKDVLINIQGDEPFLNPGQIDVFRTVFKNKEVQIATLVRMLKDPALIKKDSIIKVVFDKNSKALYFSRSPIPFVRDKKPDEWPKSHAFYHHIGIYAFRLDVLQQISILKRSKLETAESLEQLRWMENGFSIHVEKTEHETISIDTPDDLRRLENNINVK